MNPKKQSVLFPLMITFMISITLSSCTSWSSSNTSTQLKNPDFDQELVLPDFYVATIQDSAIYKTKNLSKDGLILVKVFNPDCDHCQNEAKEYFAQKEQLKNFRTLWVAVEWADLEDVKSFSDKYQLKELNTIAVGKEVNGFVVYHYDLKAVPFTAVYQDNQLIKSYIGDVDFDELKAMNDGTYKPENE